MDSVLPVQPGQKMYESQFPPGVSPNPPWSELGEDDRRYFVLVQAIATALSVSLIQGLGPMYALPQKVVPMPKP